MTLVPSGVGLWFTKLKQSPTLIKLRKSVCIIHPSVATLLVPPSPDVKLGSLTLIRHKMTLGQFSEDLVRPPLYGENYPPPPPCGVLAPVSGGESVTTDKVATSEVHYTPSPCGRVGEGSVRVLGCPQCPQSSFLIPQSVFALTIPLSQPRRIRCRWRCR